MKIELNGKIALITGGSAGIGRGIAESLTGAAVGYLSGRSSERKEPSAAGGTPVSTSAGQFSGTTVLM